MGGSWGFPPRGGEAITSGVVGPPRGGDSLAAMDITISPVPVSSSAPRDSNQIPSTPPTPRTALRTATVKTLGPNQSVMTKQALNQ